MNTWSDSLKSTPEGAKLLSNQAQIQALLRSPDTKTVFQLLKAKNPGQLQTAAQEALHGNTAALNQLLADLTHDPNAAQAIEHLSQTQPK